MKVQSKSITYLTIAIVFGFLFLGFAYAGANANTTPDLPPRPTGDPTPEPEQPVPPAQPVVIHPQGGFISLSMAAPSPDYWVTIQWYDGKGEWYTVSGWQGNFDHKGEVVWWVAPENMGQGPFRWVVLSAEVNGRPVTISDEFYLPTDPLQTVRLDVSLD
ncbi:MAG: hypothetical protein R6X32_19740 [Chloroflexota bacterium]|jgi:hypothetical protein